MSQKELKRTKIEAYLNQFVRPVFDRLVTELLGAMPEDMISWTVDWLQLKGRKLLFQSQSALNTIRQNQDVESSEEEKDEKEETEEPIADLPGKMEKSYRDAKIRNGVSAEVYGLYHKKEVDFIPRLIEKSNDQIERIKERLFYSFMFEQLDENDLQIVIGAMEEKHYKPEEWVIKQGEDGKELYVVDSGELHCFRIINNEQKQIRTYKPGDSFGELALLYNAPRAASIQATNDVICFALDRETFNHIVKDSSMKKREKFESMLQKIQILQQMDSYERMQLCDALTEIKFHKGTTIIHEGTQGEKFFMIVEGTLNALQNDQPVFEFQEGDYFGELALFDEQQRQATVVASSDVTLIYLHKDQFKRLLGPVEGLIKRNIVKRYNQI